jgi:ferrous iron transport protein B
MNHPTRPARANTTAHTRPQALHVVLAGNPNAGKSTLFNALTGLRQHVGNFPGVTVERLEGGFTHDDVPVTVTDLPGAYSLAPESPDERIAVDVLLGRATGVRHADVIVIVVDADNIERHLYFASEILELGRPTVIALNRMDRLAATGTQIDVPELIHELGAVVIPVVATKGHGVDALRRAITLAPSLPVPEIRVGASGPDARYAWIARVIDTCVKRPSLGRRTPSDKVDRAALHPVAGPIVFVGLMMLVFQAMFSWSRPLMQLIQSVVATTGNAILSGLPPGDLRSLLADGVVGGVGNVLVFLPQITILFLFIGLLEDSGYMARAAFVMDRFMRPVGLHGRSFIPLISGYACAVPAILGARTIKDDKQRLATILVVPMISCSARLPVYTLLIGAFVPSIAVANGWLNLQGLTLLAMYVAGTVGALATAALFRKTLLRAPTRALILELPPYSLPNARAILMTVWQRVRVFLKRAGTVILAASVLLWAASHYPRPSAANTAESRLAQSALGQVGHVLEPAVRPLGYDWKIGVSIISSFAAREVFVSSMSTIYGIGDGDASNALQDRLRRATKDDGTLAYTPLVALSLMAFYVFALMCTSTSAVTYRECGGGGKGLAWMGLQFTFMLALAYGIALMVFRTGVAAGWTGI